jgi:hypothetical protein
VALKSAQTEADKAEVIEENLEIVHNTLERVKVLYEQYFMGIQKQPPTQIHTDCERRLRDLAQMHIRNTALRYRFATLQQKFGSYNSYWRRTLRQIEQGKYHRNLSKIGRHAVQTGAEIPEEILAAMPKRMREQVLRDREAALAQAKRRHMLSPEDELSLDEADVISEEEDDAPAMISEPTELRRSVKNARGPHVIDESDGDLDLDAFFAAVTNEAGPEVVSAGPSGLTASARASAQIPLIPPESSASTGVPQASRTDDTSEIPVLAGPAGMTGAVPRVGTGILPRMAQTGAIPRPATGQVPMPARTATPPVGTPVTPPRVNTPAAGVPTQTASVPVVPPRANTPAVGVPVIPPRANTPPAGIPAIPRPPGSMAIPKIPSVLPPVGGPKPFAPSQAAKPIPITPGSSIGKSTAVETMAGPFPREHDDEATDFTGPPKAEPVVARPTPPARPTLTPRPTPVPVRSAASRPAPAAKPAPQKPPPGMTDADVNALYAKYVKAKEMVGEEAGPGAYSKLLKTINAQAPKIMEQYKAKGVDFSVVVKDNQVVIRAKPKS